MNNLNHITNLKQLIRVTIDDVKLVKGDVKYYFDMKSWHNPGVLRECIVCLAGSIMAKTLGVSINIKTVPSDFDNRTESLLYLIDQIRVGEDVIYLQKLLDNYDVEFNLNNLSELNLLNYNLYGGDIDEWEKLYNDLGRNTGTKLKSTLDKIISKGIRNILQSLKRVKEG